MKKLLLSAIALAFTFVQIMFVSAQYGGGGGGSTYNPGIGGSTNFALNRDICSGEDRSGSFFDGKCELNIAADDVNDLLAAGPEEEGRVLDVPASNNNGNSNGNNNVNEQSNQNENAVIPGALPQTGVDY